MNEKSMNEMFIDLNISTFYRRRKKKLDSSSMQWRNGNATRTFVFIRLWKR